MTTPAYRQPTPDEAARDRACLEHLLLALPPRVDPADAIWGASEVLRHLRTLTDGNAPQELSS